MKTPDMDAAPERQKPDFLRLFAPKLFLRHELAHFFEAGDGLRAHLGDFERRCGRGELYGAFQASADFEPRGERARKAVSRAHGVHGAYFFVSREMPFASAVVEVAPALAEGSLSRSLRRLKSVSARRLRRLRIRGLSAKSRFRSGRCNLCRAAFRPEGFLRARA